ncbi:hypothetical protein Tco_0903783, partial [Tanacetum coccineum]
VCMGCRKIAMDLVECLLDAVAYREEKGRNGSWSWSWSLGQRTKHGVAFMKHGVHLTNLEELALGKLRDRNWKLCFEHSGGLLAGIHGLFSGSVMNPQETQQVVARDEKWVPFSKRVKISSTNVRLETTVPQKEETFQFWYSIKKVQGMDSYEFLLANKKYVVNANVFRTILDICLRVEGANFTDVPDDDTTLAFLIKLGYKGPMYKHTNMFIDHMHHPWRTLATIINKCLSGKIASNDKLRKSRIDILWGMFYKENVDYPELMKILHTRLITEGEEIKARKHAIPLIHQGEYYQEYGLPIPKTMLIEVIKQSESYQMFIKYSTGYFRPKKSIGKGSQRKKTDDDSQETVDVFEESESEPESVKRKTSSKRRLKKKVTLSANDNIIFDDLGGSSVYYFT